MNTVTLSSKFQVVIPKEVREEMNLIAGTQFQLIPFDGTLHMIPVVPMEKARGMFKGRLLGTNIQRDADRDI